MYLIWSILFVWIQLRPQLSCACFWGTNHLISIVLASVRAGRFAAKSSSNKYRALLTISLPDFIGSPFASFLFSQILQQMVMKSSFFDKSGRVMKSSKLSHFLKTSISCQWSLHSRLPSPWVSSLFVRPLNLLLNRYNSQQKKYLTEGRTWNAPW